MFLIFFILLFVPVCWADDAGWKIAVEKSTNIVIERCYGSCQLSHSGALYWIGNALPTRPEYSGIVPLRFVDTNANNVINDGEIVVQSASDITLNKLAETRIGSKAIVDNVNIESTFARAVILVTLDEINLIRSKLVPALPARTITQLKTAIKAKIDAGDAD